MTTPRCLLIVLFVSALAASSARAHPADASGAVAGEMTAAANNFLATLTADQAAKATYPLSDKERFNWHFIPRERKGLSFKEMAPEQKHLATALLSTGLSHRGFLKASTIMSLEQVLRDLEQGKGPTRDPELYFVTIFGKPDAQLTWGWRVEGHHLSLNFLLAAGHEISVTPSERIPEEPVVADSQPALGAFPLDRAFHAMLARFTGGISPVALSLAWLDWSSHLAAAPEHQMRMSRNVLGDSGRLLEADT